ncbi:MAG: hypothetical protein V4757_12880 [Pseudomonadota bacterium]
MTGLAAQTLTGLQVDRTTAKTGEPVTVTAAFSHGESINCGMHIKWGDNTPGNDYKIIDAGSIPLKATHAYAQPGDYTITAEPKKVTTHLGCVGKKRTAVVKVVAAAPAAVPAPAPAAPKAAAPAAPAPAKGPQCPEGWTLNAKSVNKKTNAFTCTAKANTPVAGNKINCPGDLTYFENSKKGQLGCRP